MRHFKVIALSVGGKGNNVYHSQQVLPEDCFENVDELVAGKFLELVEEPKETVEKEQTENIEDTSTEEKPKRKK